MEDEGAAEGDKAGKSSDEPIENELISTLIALYLQSKPGELVEWREMEDRE